MLILFLKNIYRKCTEGNGVGEREKATEKDKVQWTETESRSPMIPPWLVALQKVFHFVFKVVPIMVNFVLCA